MVTALAAVNHTALNPPPVRECCLYTVLDRIGQCIIAVLHGIVYTIMAIYKCIMSTLRSIFCRRDMEIEDPLARGISKGQHYLKKAFELDLNNANEPLFRDAHFRAVCRDANHPIWALADRDISSRVRSRIGGYDCTSSNTQHTHVKRMLSAILNRLEEIRTVNNAAYQRSVGAIFTQLAEDAFSHCTNNLMPTLDDILTGLMGSCAGGALQKKVETALQAVRMQCFATAVLNVINRSWQSSYYTTHEAATRNYYLRTMYQRLGLKAPVIDTNYQEYALTDCHEEVFQEFERIYSVTKILNSIHSIINHSLDGSISRGQFSEWANASHRVEVDLRGNVVISGTNIPMQNAQGHFDKRLVLEYLIEIGALRR